MSESPTLAADDKHHLHSVFTSPGPSDYRVDLEAEDSDHADLSDTLQPSRAGSVTYAQLPGGQAGPAPLDLASHPALPIVCYCVASICMTVINKARPPVLSHSHPLDKRLEEPSPPRGPRPRRREGVDRSVTCPEEDRLPPRRSGQQRCACSYPS